MPLEEYQAKRDFSTTPEPTGGALGPAGELRFVVQEHHARALHYDFRLELDGVLLSWAVPKGPSLDPADKRLAVRVEDHPLDYADFEGTIPAGEYGAGTVAIWDHGTWLPLGDAHAGLAKGDFKFRLFGEKLTGLWVLVRMKPRSGEKRENWLLIRERDAASDLAGGVVGVSVDGFSASRDSSPNAPAPAPASIPANPHDPTLRASEASENHLQAVPDQADTDSPEPLAAGPVAPETPFPSSVELELATLVDEAPEGDEWVAEVKYDGYRVVLALQDGRARAFTRSHAEWSDRFPTLIGAAQALPAASVILDGEAVVFDQSGISRFELLQRAIAEHPERIVFAAFDLLYLNGRDVRNLPLEQRKELLRELLGGLDEASPLRYAEHVAGGSADFYSRACVSDLEGIVCKRAASRYVPGRGREWVKVKCRQTQEFVVGGFTEGAGARTALGAVLVGTYDSERLVYAGRVGSGLSEAMVVSLREKLDALEQPASPFDPAPHITGHVVHWARPETVVQVAFREWTSEGLLRQPVFLGLREDKPAAEAVREEVVGANPRDSATPASVLGIRITNPDKPLFPESPTFTKLELARYYEAVAPHMLAEVADRPLTLVRCPTGHGRDCFYQRHPDAGLPKQVHRLAHTLKGEPVELLYVDSAEGLITLAQMGVGEIHTWMSRTDGPTRPDRICFDLDPGPGVEWPHVRSAALLVREECTALGLTAFLKSTGSKGLHIVVPIEPVWEFERVRALAKALVDRLVALDPDSLVGKMAKNVRGGHIFIDYLRNAEGASAVAAYSTRMRLGPPCAIPLAWDELTDALDISEFTPQRVLERLAADVNPWRDIGGTATGAHVLRSAEASLLG
jgi:bifunctional non-homologous end joining protein LigD